MNLAFQLHNYKAVVLAQQLGYKNNKKPGEGLAEEFIEVSKRHPDWVTIIGNTKHDADSLTGELREEGKKVLNLNEVERRLENDKNNRKN